MKSVLAKYSFTVLFLLSISSCVSKKKYNELGQYYENIENELKKSRQETADLKHQLALQKSAENFQIPITTYSFEKLSHDFGSIAMGYGYTTTFKFTNTGNEKLIFTEVRGSCTCTVPEYPRKAILPGESGEITVTFTPGMPLGEQVKYVTVMANTERKVAMLSVKGNVRKN